MAANSFTVDNLLIPQVKRLAHIPTTQTTFQPSDLCALADDETRTSILEQILSVREGYYLRYADNAVNSTGIYPIPSRAIGGRLNDVQVVINGAAYPMVRVEPAQVENYSQSPVPSYAFMLFGDNIMTLPPAMPGPVRMWHYLRPSNLVLQSFCAQVTAIGTNSVTVSAVPSSFGSNVLVDFVQDQPPFGLIGYDASISSVAGSTVNFASGVVPSNLAVGDWLCPAGQTCIPQIPLEFHPVLHQRVAVKVLEAQGYMNKLPAAQAKLTEIEKRVTSIVSPRDEGNPKIITPNRALVRAGRYRRWGWGTPP